jgi:hypothetical protein
MIFHRELGQIKVGCNLFVCQTFTDKPEELKLSWGERFVILRNYWAGLGIYRTTLPAQ